MSLRVKQYIHPNIRLLSNLSYFLYVFKYFYFFLTDDRYAEDDRMAEEKEAALDRTVVSWSLI